MNIKNRRSIRFSGYDYSQVGAYYVTICTQGKLCLFGKIKEGKMVLNDGGKLVETEWLKLKNRFANIELQEYIIMPNHFHGILEIESGQPQGIAPTSDAQHVGVPLVGTQIAQKNRTIGDILGALKSITTVEYARGINELDWTPFNGKLWQRNYCEHIIRDGNDHDRIAQYIQDNPIYWEQDKMFV